MLFLKYLLTSGGIAMIVVAAGILTYDIYLELLYRRALAAAGPSPLPPIPTSVGGGIGPCVTGMGSILLAVGIIVVPSGMAGVRQPDQRHASGNALSRRALCHAAGRKRGALRYSRPDVYHRRTGRRQKQRRCQKRRQQKQQQERNGTIRPEPLNVQAKEGLTLGLAITVRYRLDPKHLDYIQSNLPQPIEKEIVPAVVASAWRELVPNYTVREVFATKREEVRKRASDVITQKLASDGIVVKEVMLRDIQLPPEYAKGWKTCCSKSRRAIAWASRLTSIKSR